MPEDTALSVDERAELERLRSEVATLRSQAQERGAQEGRPAAGAATRRRWRTIVASGRLPVQAILASLDAVDSRN